MPKLIDLRGKIIVEIQNSRESDYLERLLYGASKVVAEHQKLGENFKNISKVIFISVLYFNLGMEMAYQIMLLAGLSIFGVLQCSLRSAALQKSFSETL
jgi:hypothetical protein